MPFITNRHCIREISKTINAFLNTKGGEIYIGINDYQYVKGVELSNKDKDVLGNFFINLTTDFYPNDCRLENIKVSFIPVRNIVKRQFPLYVILIKVKKGDSNKLYSISRYYFRSYMRVNSQNILLESEKIASELIKRSHYKINTEVINLVSDNCWFNSVEIDDTIAISDNSDEITCINLTDDNDRY